ncbi:MAG: hypothetical protein ACYCXA_00710 [Actinomycetes bacterium]
MSLILEDLAWAELAYRRDLAATVRRRQLLRRACRADHRAREASALAQRALALAQVMPPPQSWPGFWLGSGFRPPSSRGAMASRTIR